MISRFRNRTDAGQRLAKRLAEYADRPDVIVLALPRGGVPVAYEIAAALHLPLDICLVRKLGVPGQEELAMGAIAPEGIMVLNDEIVRSLRIDESTLLEVAEREQQELARRDRAYRGDRPPPDLQNRTVILVDDGIATGSTLRAAIAVVQTKAPRSIVVAVPLVPPSTCTTLKSLVNDLVYLVAPERLQSIGGWYDDFSQTSDAEVQQLLRQSRPAAPAN